MTAIIVGCTVSATTTASTPVSLNVVSQNGFLGFAAQVQLSEEAASTLGPQQLLVDTGSSALIFCNKDLAKSLTPLVYPGGSNVVLNPAGQPNDTCNGGSVVMGDSYGDNPKLYFWGYAYENELLISFADNSNTDTITGAAFAIAEAVGDLFVCKVAPGFDGIWGIAFSNAGNDAMLMEILARFFVSPNKNARLRISIQSPNGASTNARMLTCFRCKLSFRHG